MQISGGCVVKHNPDSPGNTGELEIFFYHITNDLKPMIRVPYNSGVAESMYDLPSSPTLLPREKGARTPVPSPFGRGQI